MRFAVIGSGAVGCYYGGRLARNGEDVAFLVRSDYDVIRARGLEVRSYLGDFTIPIRACRTPEEMVGADVVIVALKGTDTPALEQLLPPLLHASCSIVSLQNGMGNEEWIAARFEDFCGAIVAGSAFICSERIAPGVIEHTASGFLSLAPFRVMNASAPTAMTIGERFIAAGVKTTVDEDPKRIKWTKLIWNIPFNGLSVALGGITTDRMLADPDIRLRVEQLMREVLLAARADGVDLDPGLVEKNLTATVKMGAYRTSMLVDFQAGRPIEIESILAEPLRRGERGGAELPLMRALYDEVRARAAR